MDGGSPYHMSIIRNGNVALSILRKCHVACSLIKPKKGRVAVSILVVHTPYLTLILPPCGVPPPPAFEANFNEGRLKNDRWLIMDVKSGNISLPL